MPKLFKDEIYKNQQKETMIKILDFINVNSENRLIKREVLETESYKEFINNLLPDIKKYYCVSSWKSSFYGVEKEINILRTMARFHNICIDKIQKKKNVDGKYINETIYKFDLSQFYI